MVRGLFRELVPPLLQRALRRARVRLRFFGVFRGADEIPGPGPWSRDNYLAANAHRLSMVGRGREFLAADFIPTAVW